MNFKALYFVDVPFDQKPSLKSGIVVDLLIAKILQDFFPEYELLFWGQ
jgi:hypothetical protein